MASSVPLSNATSKHSPFSKKKTPKKTPKKKYQSAAWPCPTPLQSTLLFFGGDFFFWVVS
jgi:hypothetical protein